MTNAELAVLSLVAERPRHGYEIEQVIAERGMREWTAVGFSSIYYLLKKLEQDGLIEGRLEPAARGPARKVYACTPAGAQALRQALRQALAMPQRAYPSLQLGLANLPALAPAEALAALQQYREALGERLARLQSRQKELAGLPYFVEAMFDYSITMIQAELKWVRQFMRQIRQRDRQNTQEGAQETPER